MPHTPKPYRKLPGGSAGRVSIIALWRVRIWQGLDHLLLVQSFFGIEQYRRFYFRDIEAVIIRRTATRLIWNVVIGVIGLMFLAIAAVIWFTNSNHERDLQITAGILAGCAVVSGVLCLINTLRGPTCKVFVQTAAGKDPLTSVRLGTARKLLRRLTPEIEAAQDAQAAPAAAAVTQPFMPGVSV